MDSDNNQPPIDISEITAFDRSLWQVATALPGIRLGSILKIPEEAFANWGIGIDDSNAKELKRLSTQFHTADAERSESFQTDAEEQLNTHIAHGIVGPLVAGIIRSLADRDRITICNLAARKGGMANAIITAIDRERERSGLSKSLDFYLVDERGDRLQIAGDTFKRVRCSGDGPLLFDISDEKFISLMQTSGIKCDVVVTMANLHTKTFLSGFMLGVSSIMADDGVFVSADRHSVLCQHPYFIKILLELLCVDRLRVAQFENALGSALLKKEQISREHQNTVDAHMQYWVRLNDALTGRTTFDKDKMRYILNAYRSVEQTTAILRDAGFTTELDEFKARYREVLLHFQQGRQQAIIPVTRDNVAFVIVGMKKGKTAGV